MPCGNTLPQASSLQPKIGFPIPPAPHSAATGATSPAVLSYRDLRCGGTVFPVASERGLLLEAAMHSYVCIGTLLHPQLCGVLSGLHATHASHTGLENLLFDWHGARPLERQRQLCPATGWPLWQCSDLNCTLTSLCTSTSSESTPTPNRTMYVPASATRIATSRADKRRPAEGRPSSECTSGKRSFRQAIGRNAGR